MLFIIYPFLFLFSFKGDWPDCFQINKYVKGFHDAAKSPVDIVRHFKRWPTFMLGNLEIAALASTLREINNKRAPKDRCVACSACAKCLTPFNPKSHQHHTSLNAAWASMGWTCTPCSTPLSPSWRT